MRKVRLNWLREEIDIPNFSIQLLLREEKEIEWKVCKEKIEKNGTVMRRWLGKLLSILIICLPPPNQRIVRRL